MRRLTFFLIITALLFAGPVFAGDQDPDQTRLSFEDDAATTLTVAWRTEDAGVTDSVCYWGETPAYGNQTIGSTYTFPDATGLHHKVQITGLDPRTVYHLSCGDGGSHMFGDRTFITAPESDEICEPVRFVVLGDSRSTFGNGASLSWSTVMDSATDEIPDFIVFNGDAIAEGDEVEDGWDDWFDKSHDIGDFPMMMVWGNHEDRDGSPFPELFHMPPNDDSGTDDFWEMRYGPIHFFGLDTEKVSNRWARQRDWLHSTLGATDAIWKFAAFHRPGYSSGTTHGQEEEVVDYWAPVFDDYHLDIAFQSHDHMYERTKPIFNDATTTSYNTGTMYIVTGGAGAFCNPILNIWTWWYEVGVGVYHYVLVDILFDSLTLTAIDPFLGVELDTVTVVKPDIGNPTAFFSKDPLTVYRGQTIYFDAADSSDPCGELVSYEWDFGDGDSGEGELVEHVYTALGEVTVTLTVTDADDNTAVYSETFDVLEEPVDDDIVDDDIVDDDIVDDDVVDDDVVDDDVVDDDIVDDDIIDDDIADDDAADDDAADDDAADDDAADDDAADDDAADDDAADDDIHPDDDAVGDDDDDNDSGGCAC